MLGPNAVVVLTSCGVPTGDGELTKSQFYVYGHFIVSQQ